MTNANSGDRCPSLPLPHKNQGFLDAREKTVNVDPDNLIHPREMENEKKAMKHGEEDIQLLTF